MATNLNNPTRRAIIGALAGAPVAFIAAGPVVAAETLDTREWDAAYSAWLPVEARHDRLSDAWERADATCSPDEDACYKAMRDHIPAFNAARDALMAVPAPHTDALLVKMHIAVVSRSEEHSSSCRDDAHRLLGWRR
jgi:hypothetical protein